MVSNGSLPSVTEDTTPLTNALVPRLKSRIFPWVFPNGVFTFFATLSHPFYAWGNTVGRAKTEGETKRKRASLGFGRRRRARSGIRSPGL